MKTVKRKYERKLVQEAFSAKENRDFLLAHLKKEWEVIDRRIARDKRKKELYDTAKAAGKILLALTALCGIIVVGVVAPNVFSAFGRSRGRHRRYFHKSDFQAGTTYLKRRGYIRMRRNADRTVEIVLTDSGEQQVLRRAFGDLKIHPQEKWDGLWRIVIFDIPEDDKWAREGIRERLKRMGFYPLQKSTFAFPYPCRKEIEFLGRIYHVGHGLRFIETNAINFDDDIKAFFFAAVVMR